MPKQDNFYREGEWPAAVRGVVEAGIAANPGAAASITKFGNELCAGFLLQRWNDSTEVERQRVLSKLETWRQRLAQHDVKRRHWSSVWHETPEQARRHTAKRRARRAAERGGDGSAAAGTFDQGGQPTTSNVPARQPAHPLRVGDGQGVHGVSDAQLQPHVRNSYYDELPASQEPDSRDDTSGYTSSSSSAHEYPPVPRPRQGHSSPYFVPPPPRHDQQSHDGMATPPTGQQARKTAGTNHFTSANVALGSYVAAVRAVVQAAIEADPQVEVDFLRVGRALCQDAIVQRYDNATPSSRLRVQARLDLWRRELEGHIILRHSFRWVFGTTEEERQQKNRRRAEQTGRRVDGDQVLEVRAGFGRGLADPARRDEPQASARAGTTASDTLPNTTSAAHVSAGLSHAHDVHRSFGAPSLSPEPSEHGSDSEPEYPPVPPYGRGHASPYFVSTRPRRRSSSLDGESPYHALGRRAGASVTVLERRRGDAASGAW